jgi:sugar phosphate isomerase/epimerase
MRIALCNEVVRELEYAEQCQLAAQLGYDGLEVAPFTLSDEPHRIPASRRSELRRLTGDAGIRVTGLHWLLVKPSGLSITSEDSSVRDKTLDVMRGLVDLCADLGGSVLVHGSPKQRLIAEGQNRGEVEQRVVELLRLVAEHAADAGVTYCIEPLSRAETNFINSLAEAVAVVKGVNHPSFRTMLDNKAVAGCETEPPEVLSDRLVPAGLIGHVHVNDRDLKGPGQGSDRFTLLLRSLLRNRYAGVIGVEPFQYLPDGPTCAARAIGYLQGILECLGELDPVGEES